MTKHAIGGGHLTRILDCIRRLAGAPGVIGTAIRAEFAGRVIGNWWHHRRVVLRLIERGWPRQNTCVSSFKRRPHHERLREHWFTSFKHV